MTQVYQNIDLLPQKLFTKKPLPVFFIHWIAWIVLYFLTYLPTLLNSTKILWEGLLFIYVIMASVNFLLFYLVAFYLLPRIGIKEKRWIWLTGICIVLALAFTFAKFRLEDFRAEQVMKKVQTVNTSVVNQRKQVKDSLGFFSYRFRIYLQTNIYNTLSIIFIAFAYRLMMAWYLQESIRKELENKKLQAELSFLKMQVNPHFLFNALNNIYSLAVMEKSKKTGDSIMKLSDLIRYMLYEKEDEENKVSLDTEIKHINSFIDLQKLRYTEDIYIGFSIEGETAGKKIPPLLLFPLIENSCKHGIVNNPEKPISIEIKVTDHVFDFSIHNFKNDYLKDETGGIGLENVKKRLALLFPNKHTLNLNETSQEFSVELNLPL